MKNFEELNTEERVEVAKYLINNWFYDDSNEEQNTVLEIAYNKAFENVANDKPISWIYTPKRTVLEILDL